LFSGRAITKADRILIELLRPSNKSGMSFKVDLFDN
jgi:hypothetical protein